MRKRFLSEIIWNDVEVVDSGVEFVLIMVCVGVVIRSTESSKALEVLARTWEVGPLKSPVTTGAKLWDWDTFGVTWWITTCAVMIGVVAIEGVIVWVGFGVWEDTGVGFL